MNCRYPSVFCAALLGVALLSPSAQAQGRKSGLGGILKPANTAPSTGQGTGGSVTGKDPNEAMKNSESSALKAIAFRDSYALKEATTVDAFIAALPNLAEAFPLLPPQNKQKPLSAPDESVEGRRYSVSRTRYDIVDTPGEIVTFQPVNGFWPGAIVQTDGLHLGMGSTLEVPVPADKRAPFKITTSLPMADNFRVIEQPSASSTASAIGDLIQKGNATQWAGERDMRFLENYSEEQVAHALNISGRYLVGTVKAGLSAERQQSKHTVTAAFVEKAFTATADFEGRTRRAAFFNDRFTIDDAKELVEQKRLTMPNPPAYIKSITYGRVVLFNLTATNLKQELKGNFGFRYNGGLHELDLNGKVADQYRDTKFDLGITIIGGPQDSFHTSIPVNGIYNVLETMKGYLQAPAPLSTMRPISYTVNTLRDDQLAAMSRTTSYTVTKYVAHPIGEKYLLKMWVDITGSDDGVADNTVEVYGSLRVNGDLWWNIDREQADANKREKRQTLEISSGPYVVGGRKFEHDWYFDGSRPFRYELNLRDRDSSSSDDSLGGYGETLDLSALSGKEHTVSSGINDESTTLHIKVERIDTF